MEFVDPADPQQGPDVQRPPRRGLQALHRHLGQRRPAAREDPGAGRRPRSGRRHRRPRPRLCRGAGLSEPARVPRARRQLSPDAPASEVLRHPAVVARFQDVFDELARQSTGQLDVRRARDAARGAAVARRARDHRQRLDQSEGGAAASRRARRRPLLRSPACARASSRGQPLHAATRHR